MAPQGGVEKVKESANLDDEEAPQTVDFLVSKATVEGTPCNKAVTVTVLKTAKMAMLKHLAAGHCQTTPHKCDLYLYDSGAEDISKFTKVADADKSKTLEEMGLLDQEGKATKQLLVKSRVDLSMTVGTAGGSSTTQARRPEAEPKKVAFDPAKAEDKTYLREYWRNVDGGVTWGANNPMILLDDIMEHLGTCQKDLNTVFAEVTFQQMIVITKKLIDRPYPHKPWCEKAVKVIDEIMALMVALVRDNSPHVVSHLRTLIPLFDKRKRFYQSYGRNGDVYDTREEYVALEDGVEDTRFAVLKPGDKLVSVCFIRNINFFGEHGGFDVVLERIQDEEHPLVSSILMDIMRTFELITPYLQRDFRSSFLLRLRDAVYGYADAMPDSVRRQVSLEEITRSFSSIAKPCFHFGMKAEAEAIEKRKLSLALQFMQLPFLEASLKGVEQITKMIAYATGDATYTSESKKKNSYNYSGNYVVEWVPITRNGETVYEPLERVAQEGSASVAAAGKREGTKAVTPALLLEWTQEATLLPIVFGKVHHHELLRRCSPVVRFVAKEGDAADVVLQELWKGTKLQERLQKEVFGMIEELIPVLSAEHIDNLYTNIEALPKSAYNSQVLTFIGRFTEQAMAARALLKLEEKPYGLSIFWSLIAESSDPPSPRVTEAFGFVQRILADSPAQRDEFVKRLLDNIKEGKAIAISLRLLTAILKAIPGPKIDSSIQSLQKQHNLIDVAVHDLEQMEDPTRDDVDARLQFLECILTDSAVSTTADEACRLWNVLLASGHSELLFNWIETVQHSQVKVDPYAHGKNATQQRFSAFSVEVAAHLFREKMGTLDVAAFTEAGARMYIRTFQNVNLRLKTLRQLDDVQKVRCLDLVGLDRLESVALDATDLAAARAATRFLGTLFARVSKSGTAAAIRSTRQRQATTYLDHLLKASEAFKMADEAGRVILRSKIKRCVHLLKKAVEQDEQYAIKFGSLAEPTGSREFLAEQAFDLFPLLSNPAARDEAWSLLQLLPPNPAATEEVASLATTDTGELMMLAPNAAGELYVFHLLYRLGLVQEKIVEDEWREKFVAAGGPAGLVSVFTTRDLLEGTGEYGRRTSSLLVDIIHSSGAGLDALDDTFVHRLMNQIALLAAEEEVEADDGVDPGGDDEGLEVTAAARSQRNKTKAKGNLIANCHYHQHPKLITCDISGTAHYRVACYCVDYNTYTRVQHMTAFLKDNAALADAPAGPEDEITLKGQDFRNGQWVIWEVHGEEQFNIHVSASKGPNWAVSAILIDECPNTDGPPGCTLVGVDSETQGRWRGKYGSCGGWLLGQKSFPVFPRANVGPNAPVMGGFDSQDSQKYEWEHTCTNDPRALQQAPHPDEIEFSADDSDEEEERAAAEAARVAAEAEKADAKKRRDALDPAKAIPAPGSDQAVPMVIIEGDGAFIGPERPPAYDDVMNGDDEVPELLPPDEYGEGGALVYDGGEALVTLPPPGGFDDEQIRGPVISANQNNNKDKDKENKAPGTAGGSKVDAKAGAPTTILATIVVSQKRLLAAFLDYPNLDQWMLECLVLARKLTLREDFSSAMLAIAKIPAACSRLFSIGLTFLTRMEDDLPTAQFDVFFSLLTNILRQTSLQPGEYSATELLDLLVTTVKERGIFENDDDNLPDPTLCGCLDLMAAVLETSPNVRTATPAGPALLEYVYGPCLFSSPDTRDGVPVPKCKAVRSRAAAFSVLLALIDAEGVPKEEQAVSEKMREDLLSWMESYMMREIDILTEFNVPAVQVTAKQTDEVKKGRYTGLKNQGCTCYINSTIQQMFALPDLRRSILNVQAITPPPPERPGDATDLTKGCMMQMQNLFAYMQEGKRVFAETIDFCRSVKLNGAMISLTQQEDANEFFSVLIDQLEGCIEKDDPRKVMFREIFGGSFTHQTISKECEHISARSEENLLVSVEVAGKRNLEESLAAFVEGTDLDGQYTCEKCDRKVDACRRTVIEDLPNILCLHLTRFEFDLTDLANMQRKKINTRFDFPTTVDMRPYTKEGVDAADGADDPDAFAPDDYYVYELSGVLVHSGSANSGHYYSFIRERDEDGALLDQWHEFNDKRVEKWDVTERLDQDCFGGKYSEMSENYKPNSAYMVFYDRKVKYPAGKREPGALVTAEKGNTTKEKEVFETIWKDSIRRIHQRNLMDKASLDFMWSAIVGPVGKRNLDFPITEYRDLSMDEDAAVAQRMMQGLRFLAEIVCHSADHEATVQKIESLENIVATHTPASKWLLETLGSVEHEHWLKTLLILIPSKDVRTATSKMLAAALKQVCIYEQFDYFPEPSPEEAPPRDPTTLSPASSVKLINRLAPMLRPFSSEALTLVNSFADLGDAEKRVLEFKTEKEVVDLLKGTKISDGVMCPLCGMMFPENKIAAHAQRCCITP